MKITDRGQVEVLRGGDELPAAPDSMVVTADRLHVVSWYRNYQWDFATKNWSKPSDDRMLTVFPGSAGPWGSRSRQEVFRLHASDSENALYQNAWCSRKHRGSTYWPKFLIEHDEKLWFGGRPWRDFRSSGFYSFDTRTQQFRKYGPRHGFRYDKNCRYTCHDGVVAHGHIWLATSDGLAQVTILNAEKAARKSEPLTEIQQ